MSTNQVLYNYQKKEELKKVRRWTEEGKTKDEIDRLVNKKYVTEDEINNILEVAKLYDKENNTIQENEIDELELIVDSDEIVEEQNPDKVIMIADSSLEDYLNQPFKLYDNDKKTEMIESIKLNGIMQPLIVRPISNEKYQILAGHNRRNCGREAGLKEFPCIVKEGLTDDEASIYLIDTNLCTRDKISTMERARAYKIKYDIYKKNNVKSSIIDKVKRDNLKIRDDFLKIAKASNGTMQRYLRLTYLIPELQEIVDKCKLNISVAEKLSFLPSEEQKIILDLLVKDKIKITDAIVKKIRQASDDRKASDKYGCLPREEILKLIRAKKENSTNTVLIIFTDEEVKTYFREENNSIKIKETILKWAKTRK